MPRPATAADYAWLYGHAKYMEHKDCFRDHEALLRQAIAGKSVLDIGTGAGRFPAWCRANGASHAMGVDPAAMAVDAYFDERDMVRQGSAVALPFQSRCFDLVCSFDVLEHIEPDNIDRAMAEHFRVASERVIVSIANMPDQHMVNGELVELHLIQQPAEWWADLIARTVPGARSVRLLPVCPVRFWFDVLI